MELGRDVRNEEWDYQNDAITSAKGDIANNYIASHKTMKNQKSSASETAEYSNFGEDLHLELHPVVHHHQWSFWVWIMLKVFSKQ